MTVRLTTSRLLPAPPEAVRDLVRARAGEEDGTWVEPTHVGAGLHITADLSPHGDGTEVRLHGAYDAHVPYFGWVFGPLTRAMMRRHLAHALSTLEAEASGRGAPEAPAAPFWAPPASLSQPEVRMLATLGFVLALAGYGGALLTHTIDHVARDFDATNVQLGTLTAFTRLGTLVAIVGTAMADRWGRRRILLTAVAGVCVASFLSAFSPGLASFAVLQVLVRGAATLAGVVAFIAAVEEAPERARAWTLAISGVAGSVGFAVGAILLPVADLHPRAWRALYVLAGLGLLFMPGVSRRLLETRRYLEVTARHLPRGRVSVMARGAFGGRFALVAATGFLLNVFVAPSSQFMNRYLADERGFSAFGILLLRGTTQTVTALIAVWAGGRLAESWGRRPTARWGVVVMAAAGAVFFSAGGPLLWVMLAVWTAAGGFASPALSAFNTELFPTASRGTAGAGLVAVGVAGSVVGLLLVGALAEPLASVGAAVALTAVAPLVVGVVLISLLPEARGLDLDEISPPDER